MEVISGQYSPVGRQTERSLRRLRTQVEAEEALLLGFVFLFFKKLLRIQICPKISGFPL